MPELRSGVRRSKRLGDLQPSPQQEQQQQEAPITGEAENWALPTTQKKGGRRRAGGGRGRGGGGNAVAKGPSPARQTTGGRGRGIKLIDLDPEQPCEVAPGAAALKADKEVVAMEGGGSADKVVAVEEESGSTPVPERVYIFS